MGEKKETTEETSETRTKTNIIGTPQKDEAGEYIKETKTTKTETSEDE